MEFTVQQAQEQIQRVMDQLGTTGNGTAVERAAQFVIQPLEVLKGRLTNEKALKVLYLGFGRPVASAALPVVVFDWIQDLCDGKTTVQAVEASVDEVINNYHEVFQKMGISPQVSRTIFFKK